MAHSQASARYARAAGGAVAAPLVVPLLPPEALIAYQARLGFGPPRSELVGDRLPAHFALAFGWPELAESVAAAYRQLPPGERANAGVLALTFGEAAALSIEGRGRGLPEPLGTHNAYWMWSRARLDQAPLLIVDEPSAPLLRHFAEVTPVGAVDCAYCLPFLRQRQVFLARAPTPSLPELWAVLKDYR